MRIFVLFVGQEVENIEHVLRLCVAAKEVWNAILPDVV